MNLGGRVVTLVASHPAVASVRLTGSRADGRAGRRSDWDCLVEAADFDAVVGALPGLLAPLEPVAVQWDRLSDTACFMALLPGPTKVDLIFPDVPHDHEPPWVASAETLQGMDAHFWDWALWLASKEEAGKREQLVRELAKLHAHLLGPLGASGPPESVAEAVALYRSAREEAERRLGVDVPRALEDAVAPGLDS